MANLHPSTPAPICHRAGDAVSSHYSTTPPDQDAADGDGASSSTVVLLPSRGCLSTIVLDWLDWPHWGSSSGLAAPAAVPALLRLLLLHNRQLTAPRLETTGASRCDSATLPPNTATSRTRVRRGAGQTEAEERRCVQDMASHRGRTGEIHLPYCHRIMPGPRRLYYLLPLVEPQYLTGRGTVPSGTGLSVHCARRNEGDLPTAATVGHEDVATAPEEHRISPKSKRATMLGQC